MKKGIVMEQRRKYTIVMTHDGLFQKAHPIKDAAIGFEVDYEPFVHKQWGLFIKEKFFTLRVAALACAFLIALLPLYMIANGNETYAYVDIDINPSFELEVNEDLEVSKISPFNDDAKLLLVEIDDLEGKNIEDAIEIIINTSEEKGLINAAKNVLIGVHYLKDEEKDPIIKTIEDHFTKKPSDWDVVTVEIPEEVRATAEKNKQSMNIALANSVANQTDEQAKSIVTAEDKEVLQSFFKINKTEVDITNENSSGNGKPAMATEKIDEKGNSFKDKPHPSELKSKNGEINSSKKGNGHNNGKAKGHDKDKFNQGDHRNNGKANRDSGKKNNVEKSKQKDYHKGKDKEHKGNNGNGTHGKKHNGNGNGHENKGKNGNNGNGKNKDDGYSFGIPLYK